MYKTEAIAKQMATKTTKKLGNKYVPVQLEEGLWEIVLEAAVTAAIVKPKSAYEQLADSIANEVEKKLNSGVVFKVVLTKPSTEHYVTGCPNSGPKAGVEVPFSRHAWKIAEGTDGLEIGAIVNLSGPYALALRKGLINKAA